MNKLSIIIPVYYNELNIPSLFDKIEQVILKNSEFVTELIFVDDGSGDNSLQELYKLKDKYPNIIIIKLSKNFGSHVAILTGLHYSSGDCATVISADLQDPPEIIVDMYHKWKQGTKVVLAVREDREESAIQKSISNLYYKLMKKWALSSMPSGGFDCFLIDRKVIDILKSMEEKNSTLMGQILWCGFKTEQIFYVRKKREIGKSRWTLSKKIKLFIDSFLAFSYIPIRFVSTSGIVISMLGFFYALFLILNRLINDTVIEGWTSLMVVFLIVSGFQLITLGVVGEYLWRNLDETRKRPTFIVEQIIGVDEQDE